MACSARKIPVSVIIATRNEESRLQPCLAAVKDFDDIIVVDSNSTDNTQKIAKQNGAQIHNFIWNNRYPKKRQWCLDNLSIKNDWVFFVDADEIVTPAMTREIGSLDFSSAGYFVPGTYVFENKILRFGLKNNKLALINRHKMHFPVVDDLDIPGMGEIEGHYQPVLKDSFKHEKIGQMKNALIHNAFDNRAAWASRHQRYAAWERGINEKRAWPNDRRILKRIFIQLPFRPQAAFIHCYLFKLGFLDGLRGFRFAKTRFDYYRMI